MNNPVVTNSILELFEASCLELFQEVDCEVKRVQNCTISTFNVPHTSLDAGCLDLELETHLYVPFTALAMTYPAGAGYISIGEVNLEDWLCELNNLLMGKLKKRLFDHGTDVAIGLPSYSVNSNHPPAVEDGGEYFSIIFDADRQLFEAKVFIHVFNSELELIAKSHVDSVANGEIDFF